MTEPFIEKAIAQLERLPDRLAHVNRQGKIILRCPNPEHKGGMENNPSMVLNPNGFFKCYSCGYSGHWSDLAQQLGLQDIKFDAQEILSPKHLGVLDDALKIEEEFKNKSGQRRWLETNWYEDTDWREISGKYLKRVGARLIMDSNARSMLRLPCNYFGKRVGWVDCNIEKIGKHNYFNSNGVWSYKHVMFFDYSRKLLKRRKTLFVTEGPRDSLNLIQYGAAACCLLGAHNLHQEKFTRFEELNPEKIVFMLDGDDAGDKAQHVIEQEFQQLLYVPYEFMKLPRKKDPADIPPGLTRKIIKYYG